MEACADYEVAIIRDRAQLHAVLQEWRELLDGNVLNSNIFNDPAVIDCAIGEGAVSPYIVLVRRQGTLACVAPFATQQSKFSLQFSVFRLATIPLRLMTLFGNDFIYSKSIDIRRCYSLVFEAVRQADCDLTVLRALDARSSLWAYCDAKNGKPRGLSFARPDCLLDKSFALELPASFAEYVGELGSSTRSSLKRRTKKLLAEHSAKLTRVEAADQVPTFLAAADAVYQDAWQSKTYGGSKRDRPAEIERLQQIARHGWLQCYLLESDLGPLAFQFGYRYRDTFYACDFAFARRWAALGSGGVLMYLMLEDLYAESRPRFVHLGAGDSPQKHTFRGVPRDVADYWVIPRNRWQFVVSMQRGLSGVESAIRTLLVRTGLDNTIRRLLKHK